MKFLFCLFVTLLLITPPAPSFAQNPSAQELGPKTLDDIFGQKKKKIPPTPEQIDESFTVYDECNASDMVNRIYDCECLSVNFLQLRTENPKTLRDELVQTARTSCANTANIAGDAYQNCLGWATRQRTDSEKYCTCFANSYAKAFQKNPSDSIRGRESMMTVALNNCSSGNEIKEKKSRETYIDLLKRQGIFDTLFPGAKPNPPMPKVRSSR